MRRHGPSAPGSAPDRLPGPGPTPFTFLRTVIRNCTEGRPQTVRPVRGRPWWARILAIGIRSGRAIPILALLLVLAGCTTAGTGAAGTEDDVTGPAPQANAADVDIAPPATGFDGDRAWAHLVRQVEFGPRPAGSDAIAQARRYIIDTLAASGVEAREQPFAARTPAGEIAMANVIGTIPGERPERIALATHYDTKRLPGRFVGANDGASSTAAVLELARVLATRRNTFTIELLFFDGEEAINLDWAGDDNTYGSRHYVQAARQDGRLAGLRALVLLDLIGEANTLVFQREANSTPWLVDILWSTAARLGHRRHFPDDLFAVEDDHIPFLRAGVPAADIIDLDYPAWHCSGPGVPEPRCTASDDLDQVSAESLQIVGDVVLAAWPEIERALVAR